MSKIKIPKKILEKKLLQLFEKFVTEKKIKVTKNLKFILFYDCNFFCLKIINLNYF